MARVLIIHASAYGQTRAIAEAIAGRLRELGHQVDGVGASDPPPPAGYDAVILGSRVQYGRHAAAIAAYVRDHRGELAGMPTAFFSVSMSASEPTAGADPNGYLERFFRDTRWRPPRAIAFGGALPYLQYGRLLRFVMKQINRRAGHTTDTSRDHVFTDWTSVARFADGLAADLVASGGSARRRQPAS